MAGPIVLGAALSHVVTLTCPHCGLRKAVVERRAAPRVCPRCGQVFTPHRRAESARRRRAR
jgi:predicted RNA-binding Zn-ribbon protein involved in translation (DUF1610 family)